MAHPDLVTLVSGRRRQRHRRPQETPAPPPADCALPGSWNKDFFQELAREVTVAPWLQWTPTSGPGKHLQLKTRLGIINHWRNGTAPIQGLPSHQLACRILELREALQQETRAPAPHIHSGQDPVSSLVGNCADHLLAPDTCVLGPGPHPLSPASFAPGSTRFQQNTLPIQNFHPEQNTILDLFFFNLHDSFMPLEGDTSKPQGFWFSSCFLPLCFIIPWLWPTCLTLLKVLNRVCWVLRRSLRFSARGGGSQRAF